MIRDLLKKAWQQTKPYYVEGSICSERHLQAVLFHILQLDKEFTNHYLCFIEPQIGKKIPDMIIADPKTKKTIAIAELKYVPHGYVPFEKDALSLSFFNKKYDKAKPIKLLTNPTTGNYKEDKFFISKNLLCVFVAITNEQSFAVTNTADIWKPKYTEAEIKNNLTLLGIVHSATNNNSMPQERNKNPQVCIWEV